MSASGYLSLYDAPQGNMLALEAYEFSFCPNGTSTPTSLKGLYVVSATWSVSATCWLVTFTKNFSSIHGFAPFILASSSAAGVVGCSLIIDGTNTNLSASGGAVVALACVNTSAQYANLAADTSTHIGGRLLFSTNPVLNP